MGGIGDVKHGKPSLVPRHIQEISHEPFIPAEVAVTVTAPTAPLTPSPEAEIDSTILLDELHNTLLVSCKLVPSVNLPIAVNCCWTPSGIVALPGVTAIEVSRALPTASVVVPETPPEVALIVVLPGATPFANPGVPETLIVATDGLDEAHVTLAVMSRVPPSENLPVAVNFCVRPAATEGLVGLICSEARTGGWLPPPPPFPPPPIAPPPPQPVSKHAEISPAGGNSFPIGSRVGGEVNNVPERYRKADWYRRIAAISFVERGSVKMQSFAPRPGSKWA